MRERELATTQRLKITAPLSRILVHAPEYRALQRSGKGTSVRLSKDPSFFTIVDTAKELEVPVCAFVPSIEHQALTDAQRDLLVKAARWTLANFARRKDERGAYTSDFEDFEAYVTVRKQSHVLAASPVGVDAQFEPEEANVLASIPGIRNERVQVLRVRGNSMADRYNDGDRVLIDLHKRTPPNGEVIAVDRGHLGRTLGYWRREGKRCYLDKENAATIDLGSPDDFMILGTITTYVGARAYSRARRVK